MPNVLTEGRRTAEFLATEANGYLSREQSTLLSGENLSAGAVLGQAVVGTAAAVADGGNTGDGTMGAITVNGDAQPGEYILTITKAAANAGDFQVVDTQGDVVGIGTVATVFEGGGLSFTLADGAADFVKGDKFTITVTEGTEKFKEWNPSNTDGSQIASAILFANTDASAADEAVTIIARDAEVNGNVLEYFTGVSDADKALAAAQLANKTIIVR